MIVATNRIPVAPGFEAAFEERFRNRKRLLEKCPGFLRHEIHRPRPVRFDQAEMTWVDDLDSEGHYEIKTWWRSLEDFVSWTQSKAFKEAHQNPPPREMFRGPNEFMIHEVLTGTDLNSKEEP